MKSMTGYSLVNFENDDFKVKIEIKTVNNKNLNVNLKSPNLLNFLENRIRTMIADKVKRGSVLIRVDFEDKRDKEDLFTYDREMASSYISLLEEIENDFDDKFESKVELLLKQGNIIKKSDNISDEKLYKSIMLPVLEEALEKLNEMRSEEGKRLEEYLFERVDVFENIVEEIKKHKDQVVVTYKEKLLERVNKLSEIEFSKEDLLKEVLLFADKSDISEETSRLDSHLVQIKKEIGKEYIGKKIDFILQEMFREMNTTGVKSNFYDISKLVVDGKNELEKMREQVLNIE